MSAHALDPENKSVSGLPTGAYSVPLPQLLAFAIHLRCRSSALIFAFIFTGQGGGHLPLCPIPESPLLVTLFQPDLHLNSWHLGICCNRSSSPPLLLSLLRGLFVDGPLFLKTGSCCFARAVLDLAILLPQPPKLTTIATELCSCISSHSELLKS